MKPRISVVTLGVSDIEQSLALYRDGLGLPTEGIIGREFEHGAVAFFDLSGGLKLAIWAQDDISHDTGLPKHPIYSTAFTIGHNVLYQKEVDETMDAAQRAGAESDASIRSCPGSDGDTPRTCCNSAKGCGV